MGEHVIQRTPVSAPGGIRLLLLSVVLWAAGVVTIRVLAPTGWLTSGLSWLVLPATIPLVWLTLRLAMRIAGGMDPVLVAAFVSMPALLLDGLAFSYVPFLYGAAEDERRAGAAWLLWFVGVSLALALLRGVKKQGSRL